MPCDEVKQLQQRQSGLYLAMDTDQEGLANVHHVFIPGNSKPWPCILSYRTIFISHPLKYLSNTWYEPGFELSSVRETNAKIDWTSGN